MRRVGKAQRAHRVLSTRTVFMVGTLRFARPTRSSRAEPSLAGLVEMIADQAAERWYVVELKLDGEGHDAIRQSLAAAQARNILFRRHQRELLALRVRRQRRDLGLREHVVVGERVRVRDLDPA